MNVGIRLVELKVNKHLYLCHPLVLSSPSKFFVQRPFPIIGVRITMASWWTFHLKCHWKT